MATLVAFFDLLEKNNGAVTAVATAFIAVFTVVLALVTGKQSRVTLIAAKAAEKSADIAEKALIDLERPILQIVEPFPAVANPLRDEELGMVAHYKITNFGRTPATLHEVSLQFGPMDERPAYDTKVQVMTVIPQGVTVQMKPHDLPSKLYANARNGFAFGYLKYSDIFGFSHTTGFGLSRVDRVWIVSGGARYNYHRIERESPQKT